MSGATAVSMGAGAATQQDVQDRDMTQKRHFRAEPGVGRGASGVCFAGLRRLVGHLRRARRGATALEFAVGMPIFILLVYGLFEVGRIFWAQSTLQYAVEEAARFTMVNSTASAADVQARVEGSATGLDAGNLTIDVAFEDEAGERAFVTVTGTFNYVPVVPIVGIGAFNLVTSTRMALVQ